MNTNLTTNIANFKNTEYNDSRVINTLYVYGSLEQCLYNIYLRTDESKAKEFFTDTKEFHSNFIGKKDKLSYRIYILWLQSHCETLKH